MKFIEFSRTYYEDGMIKLKESDSDVFVFYPDELDFLSLSHMFKTIFVYTDNNENHLNILKECVDRAITNVTIHNITNDNFLNLPHDDYVIIYKLKNEIHRLIDYHGRSMIVYKDKNVDSNTYEINDKYSISCYEYEDEDLEMNCKDASGKLWTFGKTDKSDAVILGLINDSTLLVKINNVFYGFYI